MYLLKLAKYLKLLTCHNNVPTHPPTHKFYQSHSFWYSHNLRLNLCLISHRTPRPPTLIFFIIFCNWTTVFAITARSSQYFIFFSFSPTQNLPLSHPPSNTVYKYSLSTNWWRVLYKYSILLLRKCKHLWTRFAMNQLKDKPGYSNRWRF